VAELGPVLGLFHPVVTDNVERLKAISGLDEVSFHMSGTEAVMQAVRLARYHTGKSHLVRFAGAYHGWWGDVQPGVGNPVPEKRTYTLSDMSEQSLHVLKTRGDIACVLVNPLQALHPNCVGAFRRRADRQQPHGRRRPRGLWRLAEAAGRDLPRGGHRADLRRGVRRLPPRSRRRARIFRRRAGHDHLRQVAGRRAPGRRPHRPRRADAPLQGGPAGRRAARPRHVQFAPLCDGRDERVPAAAGDAADPRAVRDIDARWDGRAAALNERLEAEGLSPRVANLSSIWTVTYTEPRATIGCSNIICARPG
jgi:glutamate-1-semialdehyde 2,1-aminomutase